MLVTKQEVLQSGEAAMNATQVQARIVAEVLLGKIRISPSQPEPSHLTTLRGLINQVKRVLGEDFDPWVEENKKLAHVVADLVFDRITDTQREETLRCLKELSVPQRVAAETILAKLTGTEDPRHRWNDTLWSLRQKVRSIADTSISGLTTADIREGYHDMVHEIINQLWAKRSVLI